MKYRDALNFIWLVSVVAALVGVGGCHSPQSEAQKKVKQELALRQERTKESLRLAEKGQAALDDHDLPKARELLTKAVQTNSMNSAAWMLLGKLEFEDERLYNAADAFYHAKRLAPTRYEPRYNLGMVYERSARYVDAATEYESALELEPNQTEVLENLARVYVLSGQKPDRARDLIGQALMQENRPEWRHWLQMQLVKLTPVPASTTNPIDSASETAPSTQPQNGE